jgi:hypothetical protein
MSGVRNKTSVVGRKTLGVGRKTLEVRRKLLNDKFTLGMNIIS